jgi:hypothetical protein
MTINHTATFTFNMEDPDARAAFRRAAHADDCYHVLWELDQKLRNIIKYQEFTYQEDFLAGVQFTRDTLREVMDLSGVTFDDYL